MENKTLKELFESCGSVWLSLTQTPDVKYFKPIAYNESGDSIIGERSNGTVGIFEHYNEFALYQPPKPKKKAILHECLIEFTKAPMFVTSGFQLRMIDQDCIDDYISGGNAKVIILKKNVLEIEVENGK